MHHPYRDATRAFTRRLLLGCAVLTAAFLLLALGAWLKSFTAAPPRAPRPVAAPPPVTVTVTVTESPARRDTRGRASATFSLPPGTDGAAQAACGARAQAAALRGANRRAEAAAQAEAAEEAALASAVPALRDLKKLPAKETAARLAAWCSRHFPDLTSRPLPSSPRPSGSRPAEPRPQGARTAAPVCGTFDSSDRGPGLDGRDSGDPRCARH